MASRKCQICDCLPREPKAYKGAGLRAYSAGICALPGKERRTTEVVNMVPV